MWCGFSSPAGSGSEISGSSLRDRVPRGPSRTFPLWSFLPTSRVRPKNPKIDKFFGKFSKSRWTIIHHVYMSIYIFQISRAPGLGQMSYEEQTNYAIRHQPNQINRF